MKNEERIAQLKLKVKRAERNWELSREHKGSKRRLLSKALLNAEQELDQEYLRQSPGGSF
jgi:excinuclease UvrABC nuclease subunit